MPLSAGELAEVGRLCRAHFGSGCRVVQSRVTRRRRDYAVALITLSGMARPVAIKLAGPGATLICPFERTAAILRLVRAQTAVPVPEPLAEDVSYRDYPWRYAIMTALPGLPWHVVRQGWTVAARCDAWADLGRAVAALHTITFPAYGEVDEGGAVIDGLPYVAALAARAGRRIVDQRHRDLFLRVLDDRSVLFRESQPSCLSHEDLNPTNLLVAPDPQTGCWRLTSILD
ncbi:MAG TPA: aminoglycoside phosphotransferase family protein, partial [Thermomicrobiales bacterium]